MPVGGAAQPPAGGGWLGHGGAAPRRVIGIRGGAGQPPARGGWLGHGGGAPRRGIGPPGAWFSIRGCTVLVGVSGHRLGDPNLRLVTSMRNLKSLLSPPFRAAHLTIQGVPHMPQGLTKDSAQRLAESLGEPGWLAER